MTRVLLPAERRAVRDAVTAAGAGLVMAGFSAAVLSRAYSAPTTTIVIATLVGTLPAVVSTVAVLRRSPMRSTPADRVTLGRAVLASGCAAITVMVVADAVPARTWWLLGWAVPTLLLDAVDGAVARRKGTATVAGAQLDMQVDAVVLVVLSVAVAAAIGAWVLLIGAMRYVFVVVSWIRPELRMSLPRSRFRVVVAALQGAALAFALAPVVTIDVARVVVLLALVMLVASFGSEIVTKERLACRPVMRA